MKFTYRYYKRRVYISCRNVITVDLINVISWFRPDLECDRGGERRGKKQFNSRVSDRKIQAMRKRQKEGGSNIDSAKMEWVVNDRNRGWRYMGRHW